MIDITRRNITHYKNKGYDCRIKTNILVKIEDLVLTTHYKVTAICDCGNEKIISFSKYIINKNRCGYYGCKKCSTKKREILSMERYGVSNPAKLDSVKQKIGDTMERLYGKRNISQVEEFKEKCCQTNMEKRGVRYVLSCPIVRDKGKRTFEDKYGEGITSYTQTDEFKERVDIIWKNKSKDEKDDIVFRIQQTCLEIYGETSYSKTKKHRKEMSELLGRKDVTSNRVNSKMDNVIKRWNIRLENLFEVYSYDYKKEEFEIKDLISGDIFNISSSHLSYRYFSSLPINIILYPIDTKQSIMERQMIEYCREFTNNVTEGSRNILFKKELDIYLEDYKTAIEFNGLFWHSDKYKPINYHLNKTIEANNLGVDLLHIFDDEWINKRDIVKSYIRNIFNKNENIYYDDLELVKINKNIASDFHILNNINGYIDSNKHFGLYRDGILYYVYSMKNSKLLRFTNKIGYNIINIENFVDYYKNNIGKSITIICDRRLLDINNFFNYKTIEYTLPNFIFLKNGKRVDIEDKYKVYDCGNIILKYFI